MGLYFTLVQQPRGYMDFEKHYCFVMPSLFRCTTQSQTETDGYVDVFVKVGAILPPLFTIYGIRNEFGYNGDSPAGHHHLGRLCQQPIDVARQSGRGVSPCMTRRHA